ncbi:MAG TPA: hypothetical protein VGO93_14615, partial [Candidatus Xenobia bacterium]
MSITEKSGGEIGVQVEGAPERDVGAFGAVGVAEETIMAVVPLWCLSIARPAYQTLPGLPTPVMLTDWFEYGQAPETFAMHELRGWSDYRSGAPLAWWGS